MENLGFKVKIILSDNGIFHGGNVENPFYLRNVTEIHYNYQNSYAYKDKKMRIAFESDIHGTGNTYNIGDIAEFEALAETELAESF